MFEKDINQINHMHLKLYMQKQVLELFVYSCVICNIYQSHLDRVWEILFQEASGSWVKENPKISNYEISHFANEKRVIS